MSPVVTGPTLRRRIEDAVRNGRIVYGILPFSPSARFMPIGRLGPINRITMRYGPARPTRSLPRAETREMRYEHIRLYEAEQRAIRAGERAAGTENRGTVFEFIANLFRFFSGGGGGW